MSLNIHGVALLFFAGVLLLSAEQTEGGPTKNNTNFCRRHIFSPQCRGQQKRDIMSRSNEEYRMPVLEEMDRSRDLAAIINSPTLLGELLRKLIEAASAEYEADSNYLK